MVVGIFGHGENGIFGDVAVVGSDILILGVNFLIFFKLK